MHGKYRMYAFAVGLTATLAACGGSGGGGDAEPTVPRISSTAVNPNPTPVPGTMGTAPAITTGVPGPTPVPGTLGTSPAVLAPIPTAPVAGEVTAAPALAPLPTAGTTTTTIAMLAPLECSPRAISASTGLYVTGLSCRAGWATATTSPCAAGQSCPNREVFHVSSDGSGRVEWLHLGSFDATCAESLATAGMTIGTAAYLAPICDQANVPAASNIPPGSQDPRVPALQVALISLGYPIALDGTYGPATEAAVRDFQRQLGLEVDGIAGPQTQAALGM